MRFTLKSLIGRSTIIFLRYACIHMFDFSYVAF